jgi:hypothetical protein
MPHVLKFPHLLIDSIHTSDWVINGWSIVFLLSERQLNEIKKRSKIDNWYEDPVIKDTYIERLCICFNSIKKVYTTLGVLAQVGDRLFDEASGMIIQERSFDGNLMTITYTLSV